MHIPDLDIYRLANLLMKSRGDGAVENATRRAEHFAREGDVEGEAVWRRVVAAIGKLQRMEPDGAVQ